MASLTVARASSNYWTIYIDTWIEPVSRAMPHAARATLLRSFWAKFCSVPSVIAVLSLSYLELELALLSAVIDRESLRISCAGATLVSCCSLADLSMKSFHSPLKLSVDLSYSERIYSNAALASSLAFSAVSAFYIIIIISSRFDLMSLSSCL